MSESDTLFTDTLTLRKIKEEDADIVQKLLLEQSFQETVTNVFKTNLQRKWFLTTCIACFAALYSMSGSIILAALFATMVPAVVLYMVLKIEMHFVVKNWCSDLLQSFYDYWSQKNADRVLWVATKHPDTIVGCCGLVKTAPDTASLQRLVVERQFRGLKVGHLLVQHTIEQSSLLGYKTLTLVSTVTMTEARRLYESVGFKVDQIVTVLFGIKKVAFYSMEL